MCQPLLCSWSIPGSPQESFSFNPWSAMGPQNSVQPGLSLFCRCPCSFQNVPVSFLVSLKSSWNPPGRLMFFLVTSPKSGSASFLLLAPPTTLCSSAAFLRGPRVVCTSLLLWAEWELLEGRALSCSSSGGDDVQRRMPVDCMPGADVKYQKSLFIPEECALPSCVSQIVPSELYQLY